jgi:hypothetical protein
MIYHNKKINPILGVGIGIILTGFGAMGVILLFGEIWDFWMIMLIAIPFILVGLLFMQINMSFIGLKRIATKIDDCASNFMPDTYIGSTFSITKIKGIYILKYNDKYLSILRMKEKQKYTPSWIRRVYLGPKIPTNIPLKCPIAAEFHGFKIRRCEGDARVYDRKENCWISGNATMFSIFFFSQAMSLLLDPSVFDNFISLIDQLE